MVETYKAETRRYMQPVDGLLDWDQHPKRWALKLPWASYSGARALVRHIGDEVPAEWSQELSARKVLIVGTGPSLDRVTEDFFAGYDTAIYINFALRRRASGPRAYFFTTDLGPFREYLDTHGADDFIELGAERCIAAPVYFDQWHYLREEGRDLFTFLAPDSAGWQPQKVRVGPIRLPLLWRYYPRQPVWDDFRLPGPGRRLPIMRHTSALSAILFAAMNGASAIGMIGCDFSVGRAQSAQSSQIVPTSPIFAGAIAEFHAIQSMLASRGITLVNNSWEV